MVTKFVNSITPMWLVRWILNFFFPKRIKYFVVNKRLHNFVGITNVEGYRFIKIGKNTFFKTFKRKKW